MTKEITITMSERKARILVDNLYSQMKQLDEEHKQNRTPRALQSANVLEEIYEELREKINSD